MAVGSGLAVANLYYSQPLLPEIARDLGATEAQVGSAAALTQAGYGLGMLLLVPLGDAVERRRLILVMLAAAAVALVGTAFVTGVGGLGAAAFAVGLTSVAPQLLVPFAAHLAPPERRGQVVGTVMGGLLLGILLSRTASGLLAAAVGWRGVFGIAAGVSLALAAALRLTLPFSRPAGGLGYVDLLRSLPRLVREEPVLRESCVYGAAGFWAFSAFWTTLAFFLAGPAYGYGSRAAGLFGLAGAAGAAAAPLVGRLGDRVSPRLTVGLGLGTVLFAYILLWAAGTRLGGLIAGVVLLDLGAQAAHVSNQSRIFALRPEARNRLNTVYMVAFFAGGWAGSSAAAYAWSAWGWGGVCGVALAAVVPAVGYYLRPAARSRP